MNAPASFLGRDEIILLAAAEKGKGCYVYKSDGYREDGHFTWPNGESMVAINRQGCSEDSNKVTPVHCPRGLTSSCTWRGTPEDGGIWGDCDGQCHTGETAVVWSKWRGSPLADINRPRKDCRVQKYYCPQDTGLYKCAWRSTSPDCVDSNYKSLYELQINSHTSGDSYNACSWGREKIDSCMLDYNFCSQTNRHAPWLGQSH
ncbi:uncharacterized protein GLRG_09166 [Colletotrichum graminicola M1.001]|uniref:Uncharacterized protein n=1 Tax=Colletotrichum graminicola (strain M1.001 / M2 / FGSC 10212) TaxID=645133 RepID=E3QT34_COLGM|nr:uncharacterized protein GLRG_09166 [Colletotrichum graminicola M1.001]EFQ34022.1 hypothetical protein GLRG_09166 [Colletotrichum graminicola M1.001]